MVLSYGVSAALYYIDAIPFWVNYLLPYNCLTYCFSTIMTKGAGNTDSQLDKVYLEILAMLAQGVVFFTVCVILDINRVNGYKGADGRENYTERE